MKTKKTFLTLVVFALLFSYSNAQENTILFNDNSVALSGTYSIGYGDNDDYLILYYALQDLQTNGASGPVVFELSVDYNPVPEAYPIYINAFAGASETNTITIRPAVGTTHLIERETSNEISAVFAIVDASHVIIDGSNNGTNSRDITVQNLAELNQTAPIALFTDVIGGENITIKNLKLKAGSKTFETAGIFIDGYTNVSVENNEISNCLIGVTVENGENISIQNNIIGSDNEAEFIKQGIGITFSSNLTILGNTIKNIVCDNIDPANGMFFTDCTGDILIAENKIESVVHTANEIARGIGLSDLDANYVKIYNNSISGIASNSFTDDYPTGIAVFCPAMTSGIDISYNTIYLQENNIYGAGTGDDNTYVSGISISETSGIVLTNNIIYNNLGERDGSSQTIYGAAILTDAISSPFAEIDYNTYFTDGDFDMSFLALTIEGPKDLATWQTWTGGDAHSFYENPMFTSVEDLTLTACSPAIAHANFLPIIPGDINSNLRDQIYPTQGAYEYEKIQASEVYANVGFFGGDINWINGNGCKRAVFIKEGYELDIPILENGHTYSANSEYPLGEQVGQTDWYCVYNGDDDHFEITAEINYWGWDYIVIICEYFGDEGSEIYLTNTAINNPVLFNWWYESVERINNLFSIYPNPTTGKFIIDIKNQQLIKNISVIDITGKVVKQIDNSKIQNIEIDLSNNAKGLYFIQTLRKV